MEPVFRAECQAPWPMDHGYAWLAGSIDHAWRGIASLSLSFPIGLEASKSAVTGGVMDACAHAAGSIGERRMF